MTTKKIIAQVGMQIIGLVLAAISFEFTIATISNHSETLYITVGAKFYYYYKYKGTKTPKMSMWDCDQTDEFRSECYSWKYLNASVILLMILMILNIILIILRKIEAPVIQPHMKKVNIVIKVSAVLALAFGISGISYVCSASHYMTIEIHTVILLVFIQMPIVLGLFLEFKAFQRKFRLLDDYE